MACLFTTHCLVLALTLPSAFDTIGVAGPTYSVCRIGVASFNVGVDPRRMRGRSTSFKAKLAMTLLYRAFVFWLLARAQWSDLRVVLGSTYLWPLWGPVMCGANPCDDGLSQVMVSVSSARAARATRVLWYR